MARRKAAAAALVPCSDPTATGRHHEAAPDCLVGTALVELAGIAVWRDTRDNQYVGTYTDHSFGASLVIAGKFREYDDAAAWQLWAVDERAAYRQQSQRLRELYTRVNTLRGQVQTLVRQLNQQRGLGRHAEVARLADELAGIAAWCASAEDEHRALRGQHQETYRLAGEPRPFKTAWEAGPR